MSDLPKKDAVFSLLKYTTAFSWNQPDPELALYPVCVN